MVLVARRCRGTAVAPRRGGAGNAAAGPVPLTKAAGADRAHKR
jgi:hypothetical protein